MTIALIDQLERVAIERDELLTLLEKKNEALRYYVNSRVERTNCIPPHRTWTEDNGKTARDALALVHVPAALRTMEEKR